MASKRKSTVPCMIPAKSKYLREEGCLPELLPTIPEDSILSISGQEKEVESQRTCGVSERGTHRCLPCSFQTTGLNLFLRHMESCHMDFHTQPKFYCVNCKVLTARFEGLALHNAETHPELQVEGRLGKASLQVTKRNGVLTVEQMVFTEKDGFSETGISITKTPIMRMMVKGEPKKMAVSHTNEVQRADAISESSVAIANGTAGQNIPTSQILTDAISLPVATFPNSGISVTQNMKPLWNSSPLCPDLNSNLPKVMIPLSSIPTYDPAMDRSSFLKASFGKFPYPTKAELCYLTVVSGFPEEQIKLWFAAQRLKQGISWSPEEIEDTRRRMFNTVFQTAPAVLQSQSREQVPQHYVSSQPASVSASFTPHPPQSSVMGRKGGVIGTQPGTTQGSSLKHHSIVQIPLVTIQHGIFTKEPGNVLSSQKAESSLLSHVGIASNHVRSEKTEPGSLSSGTVGSPGCSLKQTSSCSEGSLMNLTNVVRKFDYNVNNTNCTSKPNISPAFIYRQGKASSDMKESSNIATSSKSNNGSIYDSTSHGTICTKKRDSISNHISKAKNTDSGIICSSAGVGELLLVQTSSLLDPLLSKSKSKLPEQLEALKQSIINSPFPDQKLLAARGMPVWEVDKPFNSHSSADSHLAFRLFVGNMAQTSLCSEKHSPKLSTGAAELPYTDFTAIHNQDHDLPALEDHPEISKAVLDGSHFKNKTVQRQSDSRHLEQQKSPTNNTDEEEQCGIVHQLCASQKDKIKETADLEEMPSLQQHTEEEDHSSCREPKTESVQLNSKTLNKAEHMTEASKKINQHLNGDEGSCENGPSERYSLQHIPATEHFVKSDKCINKKAQMQDDQTKELETERVKTEFLKQEPQNNVHSLDTQLPVLANTNPDGIKEASEKSPAKDHWLMKEEEPQPENQSR